MTTVFKLDARNYSFTDNTEVTGPFNETGVRAYEINKIPTSSPYNANAGGPFFQSDAPKRFEFEIVGGSGNPYDGLILPSTVNSELTDLGGSAFSIVAAIRLRDFHISASNAGMIMFCQGVSDSGVWALSTQEVSASTFRIRFGTTNAAGSTSVLKQMDEILDPNIWWVVSGNYNGSTWFWHLDTVEQPDIGTGITNPGTRTSVACAIGVSNAAATSVDGDIGFIQIDKPQLSTTALRNLECDLMDYFKGQPCAAQAGMKEYCEGIDAEIN